MQSISSYINPNTRALTSNYKNTVIKDKEAYNGAMSQHLLNPVEDLAQALKTPIKLAKGASLSRQNNSVNIAEGQSIRVNGGHVLTVTTHGVEVSGGLAKSLSISFSSTPAIFAMRRNRKHMTSINTNTLSFCNINGIILSAN